MGDEYIPRRLRRFQREDLDKAKDEPIAKPVGKKPIAAKLGNIEPVKHLPPKRSLQKTQAPKKTSTSFLGSIFNSIFESKNKPVNKEERIVTKIEKPNREKTKEVRRILDELKKAVMPKPKQTTDEILDKETEDLLAQLKATTSSKPKNLAEQRRHQRSNEPIEKSSGKEHDRKEEPVANYDQIAESLLKQIPKQDPKQKEVQNKGPKKEIKKPLVKKKKKNELLDLDDEPTSSINFEDEDEFKIEEIPED